MRRWNGKTRTGRIGNRPPKRTYVDRNYPLEIWRQQMERDDRARWVSMSPIERALVRAQWRALRIVNRILRAIVRVFVRR